jgi:bacterioferritin
MQSTRDLTDVKTLRARACKHEQGDADRIAERIAPPGVEPGFSPDRLTNRSHAENVPGRSLVQMIEEDLVAERIAIDSYREAIQYLGD